MLKVFISQPMRGRTIKEITKERELAIEQLHVDKNKVKILDTIFDDFSPNTHPLMYLAKSIEYLAQADVAIFIGDWKQYRGCKIEHECAVNYGIPIRECQ